MLKNVSIRKVLIGISTIFRCITCFKPLTFLAKDFKSAKEEFNKFKNSITIVNKKAVPEEKTENNDKE